MNVRSSSSLWSHFKTPSAGGVLYFRQNVRIEKERPSDKSRGPLFVSQYPDRCHAEEMLAETPRAIPARGLLLPLFCRNDYHARLLPLRVMA